MKAQIFFFFLPFIKESLFNAFHIEGLTQKLFLFLQARFFYLSIQALSQMVWSKA